MKGYANLVRMYELFKPKICSKSKHSRSMIINGYKYTLKEIDFGKEGILESSDGNVIIKFDYTYRDGLYIQIKRNSPYKILFEYTDRAYYINTDEAEIKRLSENLLSKFKDDLDTLHLELSTVSRKRDAYSSLENIIFNLTKTIE